ncbi:v-type proton ATPase subunit E [Striga asiatica]|uniref:V-type proton ATPase subunit E n=1 Tax=Striga asiatica TaxID=4170 RepID=A0A5A7R498_STRAF|nr:v-type proton ATPase subunit E [Striga asiatica]
MVKATVEDGVWAGPVSSGLIGQRGSPICGMQSVVSVSLTTVAAASLVWTHAPAPDDLVNSTKEAASKELLNVSRDNNNYWSLLKDLMIQMLKTVIYLLLESKCIENNECDNLVRPDNGFVNWNDLLVRLERVSLSVWFTSINLMSQEVLRKWSKSEDMERNLLTKLLINLTKPQIIDVKKLRQTKPQLSSTPKHVYNVRAKLSREYYGVQLVTVERDKNFLEAVANGMREKGDTTHDQCKGKWKDLVNRYKFEFILVLKRKIHGLAVEEKMGKLRMTRVVEHEIMDVLRVKAKRGTEIVVANMKNPAAKLTPNKVENPKP